MQTEQGGGIERILDFVSGELIALIVRKSYVTEGVVFVTGDDSVHQLGVLCWPAGHVIDAHVHNTVERNIFSTQEVLFVRSGHVRVDLYSADQQYLMSTDARTGDVLFLASGGHGFEMLEPTEIVELKQGPYLGDHEKTRFLPRDNPYFDGAES